jgi:hypothetical protein
MAAALERTIVSWAAGKPSHERIVLPIEGAGKGEKRWKFVPLQSECTSRTSEVHHTVLDGDASLGQVYCER